MVKKQYNIIHGTITDLDMIKETAIIRIEPSEHIFWLPSPTDFNGQKLKVGDKVKVFITKHEHIIIVKD